MADGSPLDATKPKSLDDLRREVAAGAAERVQAQSDVDQGAVSDTQKAWNIGLANLEAVPQSVLGLTKNVVGLDGDPNLAASKAISDNANRFAPRVQELKDIHGVGDAAAYARNTFLESAPTMVPIMAAGALTGGLADVAAGGAAAVGAADAAAVAAGGAEAATGLNAAQIAARAARAATISRGQFAGALAGSSAAQATQVQESATDTTDPTSTKSGRAAKAILGSIATGALDALPEVSLLHRFGIGGEIAKTAEEALAHPTASTIAGRIAKHVLEQGAYEGTTEALQAVGEHLTHKWVNDHEDLMSPAALSDYLNSFAGGAVVGGIMAAPAGFRNPDHVAKAKENHKDQLLAAGTTLPADQIKGADGTKPGPTGGSATPTSGQAPAGVTMPASEARPLGTTLAKVGEHAPSTSAAFNENLKVVSDPAAPVSHEENAPAGSSAPAALYRDNVDKVDRASREVAVSNEVDQRFEQMRALFDKPGSNLPFGANDFRQSSGKVDDNGKPILDVPNGMQLFDREKSTAIFAAEKGSKYDAEVRSALPDGAGVSKEAVSAAAQFLKTGDYNNSAPLHEYLNALEPIKQSMFHLAALHIGAVNKDNAAAEGEPLSPRDAMRKAAPTSVDPLDIPKNQALLASKPEVSDWIESVDLRKLDLPSTPENQAIRGAIQVSNSAGTPRVLKLSGLMVQAKKMLGNTLGQGSVRDTNALLAALSIAQAQSEKKEGRFTIPAGAIQAGLHLYDETQPDGTKRAITLTAAEAERVNLALSGKDADSKTVRTDAQTLARVQAAPVAPGPTQIDPATQAEADAKIGRTQLNLNREARVRSQGVEGAETPEADTRVSDATALKARARSPQTAPRIEGPGLAHVIAANKAGEALAATVDSLGRRYRVAPAGPKANLYQRAKYLVQQMAHRLANTALTSKQRRVIAKEHAALAEQLRGYIKVRQDEAKERTLGTPVTAQTATSRKPRMSGSMIEGETQNTGAVNVGVKEQTAQYLGRARAALATLNAMLGRPKLTTSTEHGMYDTVTAAYSGVFDQAVGVLDAQGKKGYAQALSRLEEALQKATDRDGTVEQAQKFGKVIEQIDWKQVNADALGKNLDEDTVKAAKKLRGAYSKLIKGEALSFSDREALYARAGEAMPDEVRSNDRWHAGGVVRAEVAPSDRASRNIETATAAREAQLVDRNGKASKSGRGNEGASSTERVTTTAKPDKPAVQRLREKLGLRSEAAKSTTRDSRDVGITPPPKPGMVRLYRGEIPNQKTASVADWIKESPIYQNTMKAAGRWFTDNLAEAQWYIDHEYPGGKISYVDVPAADAEKYRVSNMEKVARNKGEAESPRAFSRRPEIEHFLPADVAAARQALVTPESITLDSRDIPGTVNEIAKSDGKLSPTILAKLQAVVDGITTRLGIAPVTVADGTSWMGALKHGNYSSKEGVHTISMNSARSGSAQMDTLLHELGHHVVSQTWKTLDKDARVAVLKDYRAWRAKAKQEGRTIGDVLSSRNTKFISSLIAARADKNAPFSSLSAPDRAYALSINEYLADNLAKALGKNPTTRGVVAKFFQDLALKLIELYKGIVGPTENTLRENSRYQPAKTAEAWVQGLLDTEAARMINSATSADEQHELLKTARAGIPVTPPSTTPNNGADSASPSGLFHLLNTRDRRTFERVLSYLPMREKLYALATPEQKALLAKYSTEMSTMIDIAAQAFLDGKLTGVSNNFRSVMRNFVNVIKIALGMKTDRQLAEKILNDYKNGVIKNDGKYDGNLAAYKGKSSIHAELLGKHMNSVARALEDTVYKQFLKLGSDVGERLRASQNPALRELATLIDPLVGERSNDIGFNQKNQRRFVEYVTPLLEAAKALSADEKRTVIRALQAEQRPTETKLAATYDALLKGYADLYTTATKKGELKIGQRANYIPVVMDTKAVREDPEDFAKTLKLKDPRYVDAIRKELGTVNEDGEVVPNTTDDIDTLISELVRIASDDALHVGAVDFTTGEAAPGFKYKNPRLMGYIQAYGTPEEKAAFAKYQSDDMDAINTGYARALAKRVEFQAQFGKGGSKIKAILEGAVKHGATPEQIQQAKDYVNMALGSYKAELNPGIKWAFGKMDAVLGTKLEAMSLEKWAHYQRVAGTYQNLRLLPLAAFSSFTDPLGLYARTGDITIAIKAWRMALSAYGANSSSNDLRAMAEHLYVIQRVVLTDSYASSVGGVQDTGSVLGRINNAIFKLNGLESITRYSHLASVAAANMFLLKHAFSPSEHSERFLKELDLTAADIKRDPSNPNLVVLNEKTKDAIYRFDNEAVLRPKPTQRPGWQNDPNFIFAAQYRGYLYSFYNTVLKRLGNEVAMGNSAAVVGPIIAYVGVTMVAEIMRETVRFGLGGNPNRKDWGLADYFWLALMRSGLYGPKSQLLTDTRSDVSRGNPLLNNSLYGPSGQQLIDLAKAAVGSKSKIDAALETTPGEIIFAKHAENIIHGRN